MIFLVFIYRCIVSFASTNDLAHLTNGQLATISKVFFHLTQLPLKLAICWNHARVDYRTVVDAGASLPRKARENGKPASKWPTIPLEDAAASVLLRFKWQHRLPVSDSVPDIVPFTQTETSIRARTSTLVSINDGDIEKQSILSTPSTSSRLCTVRTTPTDAYSTYLIEKEQWLSVLSPPLVEGIGVWTPRRPIWDW